MVDNANKRVRTAEQEEGQDTEEEDAAGSEDHLLNEQVSGITVLQNMHCVYWVSKSIVYVEISKIIHVFRCSVLVMWWVTQG